MFTPRPLGCSVEAARLMASPELAVPSIPIAPALAAGNGWAFSA
jgi:hypothetical protein